MQEEGQVVDGTTAQAQVVQVEQVVDATKVALLQQGQQVVPLVVVLAPLVPTTFISTHSWGS